MLDATVVRASDKATVTINELTRATNWNLFLFAGLDGSLSINDVIKLAARIADQFGNNVKSYIVIADRLVPHDTSVLDQVLLDTLHPAHERYGITSPAFYLMRPDTYIGARGPIKDADKLITHLATIFAEAGRS